MAVETTTASQTAAVDGPVAVHKPKRVRTGCLTCRERHLKCDEATPTCQNCLKSSRVCKRGIRLNFIDTQVQQPPVVLPLADWTVQFQDESRDIASEYQGGLLRYAQLEQTVSPPSPNLDDGHRRRRRRRRESHEHSQTLGIRSLPSTADGSLQASESNSDSPYAGHGVSAFSTPRQLLTPTAGAEARDYLHAPEEVLFMQVFVEEVGLWMDSLDPQKHFSELLPYHALSEPMLLNAFLACGARHLSLVQVDNDFHQDKALLYYDTATTQLLRSVQNPDRDMALCATVAVILNVYEIMSERALQRMNHIAGARALIKECGWSARSTGIGAACFWLNVGMELLSCLHFNWQVAWDPETWGVDMTMQRETELGREHVWVHRILYLVGKIANFRATIPRFREADPRDEQARLQNRFQQWQHLMDMCERWNRYIPRSMHPLAYLHPTQTSSQSAFPEVWLVKRISIVARLFYHTAMTLLPQINPLTPADTEELREMTLTHARQICGIVGHVKDRGVSSVALRSLYIGAEVLADRREQEEVLRIFDKIRAEAGWRITIMHRELKEKWGWREEPEPPMLHPPSLAQPLRAATAPVVSPPTPAAHRPPRGILNPLLRSADFSLPDHPYQQHYQPPNLLNPPTQSFFQY